MLNVVQGLVIEDGGTLKDIQDEQACKTDVSDVVKK